MSDLTAKLEQIQVSLATKGKLDEFLAPRLWEALRVNLQSLYRQATGETMAVLVVEADAIAAKDREIAETRQRTIEECAKVADAELAKHNTGSGFDSQPAYSAAFAIATAIRSLGKEGSGEQ